ncbi:MAG TPA: tripartite tricarboxylate transporter substrate binding protein [Burkholderiales bacterium]|nr:tripartite tricarboxylate transporter substrate binding protein [Burkholderiales bacterium]
MQSGIAFFLCIALAGFTSSATAAAYPDHPVRLIVPYPPGGNIDITARTIAPGLAEALGVQIVVDNRGGAGGTIGSEMAAKAAPDGYTLLMGSTGTLATAKALYPKLAFEPLKDFAYTSLVSSVALVAITIPSLPARDLKQFIALLKARPGGVTMASAGIGTSNHLTGEYFQTVTRTKLVHVPYKGSGPALVDLMGGQVDMMFDQVSSSIGHVKGGKLRALAVTTLKRTGALPEVPTMDESGLRGFEASTTTGILLPVRTPPDIVKRVYAAVIKTLRLPATREGFARVGADVLESTPEELDKLMRAENVKWSKVIRDANVKVE